LVCCQRAVLSAPQNGDAASNGRSSGIHRKRCSEYSRVASLPFLEDPKVAVCIQEIPETQVKWQGIDLNAIHRSVFSIMTKQIASKLGSRNISKITEEMMRLLPALSADVSPEDLSVANHACAFFTLEESLKEFKLLPPHRVTEICTEKGFPFANPIGRLLSFVTLGIVLIGLSLLF
jgi:hypothetical protein